MSISIFGLGDVECALAAYLSSEGHQVVGVDVNPFKVNEINSGMSSVLEKRI